MTAAQETHDEIWRHIANYNVESGDPTRPRQPNSYEKNFILLVGLILTEDLRGIVNVAGVPGGDNFNKNVILGIMYYYTLKGWPILPESFLETVYEGM